MITRRSLVLAAPAVVAASILMPLRGVKRVLRCVSVSGVGIYPIWLGMNCRDPGTYCTAEFDGLAIRDAVIRGERNFELWDPGPYKPYLITRSAAA